MPTTITINYSSQLEWKDYKFAIEKHSRLWSFVDW